MNAYTLELRAPDGSMVESLELPVAYLRAKRLDTIAAYLTRIYEAGTIHAQSLKTPMREEIEMSTH